MLARTPAAEKKRHQRSLARRGCTVIPVEVSASLVEMLLLTGRVNERQSRDRVQLRRAVELALRQLADRWHRQM